MKTIIDLTDRFPMKFDVERMKADLKVLEKYRWIGHYDAALAEGWTAVPLVSRDGTMNRIDSQRIGKWGRYKRTPVVDSLPYFREILDAFQCPQGRIRIMKMIPGTIIRPHRDVMKEVACYAFGQVRLHIPIVTNDKVVFSVGGENLKLQSGRLYYVNFSKTHYVRNDGDTPRVHMVLDLKVDKFLHGIFPAPSIGERIENCVVRCALPPFWYSGYGRMLLSKQVWRLYEGSWIQRARHRLLPKRSG